MICNDLQYTYNTTLHYSLKNQIFRSRRYGLVAISEFCRKLQNFALYRTATTRTQTVIIFTTKNRDSGNSRPALRSFQFPFPPFSLKGKSTVRAQRGLFFKIPAPNAKLGPLEGTVRRALLSSDRSASFTSIGADACEKIKNWKYSEIANAAPWKWQENRTSWNEKPLFLAQKLRPWIWAPSY